MHGLTSGIMSELQGGTFGSGFAAGAISSLISSGIEGLGQTGGVGTDAKGNEFALSNNFGSSPLFKATMLAAGGLSGGISSSIAGGNFWAGVRQGLIVSGLNHLAHSVANSIQERSILEKMIRDGGYGKILDDDPDLNWSNGEIREFAEKVFPNLYNSANCPEFEKQLMIGDNPNIAGRALKEVIPNNDKTFTVRSLGKILIRSNILSSIRNLASTVGHELNHAVDHVTGVYTGWFNQFKGKIANAYSEVKAYEWQISVGACYDPNAYNNYLNIKNGR